MCIPIKSVFSSLMLIHHMCNDTQVSLPMLVGWCQRRMGGYEFGGSTPNLCHDNIFVSQLTMIFCLYMYREQIFLVQKKALF